MFISNRNDCSSNDKGQRQLQRALDCVSVIPEDVWKFFQNFSLTFPENGTVIITPQKKRKTCVNLNGRRLTKNWHSKKRVTLEFKDGKCVSVS